MTLLRCLLVFTSTLYCSTVIYCQDKIYLQNNSILGKITDITATEIKYLPLEKPGTVLLLPLSKALILVNSRGMVLIPPRQNSEYASIKDLVKGFLSPDTNHVEKDQLYILPRNKLEGTIKQEDKYTIYLSDGTRVDKKSLVALIYSNGQSMVYGPTDQAALLLESFQQDVIRAHTATSPATPGTMAPANLSSAPITPVPNPSAPSASDTAAFTQKAAADSAQALTFATLAKGVPRKEFEEKAEKKTTQFTEYLKILCDKTAGFEELNKAIAQTLTLFVNENAMIETSSNNRNNVSTLKIRDYLLKVKKLQYDKIEIEWTHVQYVSDLKPGPDGNFYGVVSFEQVFRGYRDGKLVYSDITRKNATVVLKTYEKSIEGSTTKVWDVLLSDVGVISTKAL